ncbi:MAG: 2-oxoacid:acceptor oxidoreductase family protein [archaeon]
MNVMMVGTAGQGIKLVSITLAKVLAKVGYFVSVNVTYGASVRTGKVESMLVFDTKPIECPTFDKADIVLKLTQSDREGKRIICEKGLCKGEEIAFTEESEKHFNTRMFANMIALGKMLKVLGIDIKKLDLKQKLPAKFFENNVKAVKIGYSFEDRSHVY